MQKLFFYIVIIAFHKLESSQSPHTSAKAMLFARWQRHLWFRSSLPYARLKAMVTKISKWSRTQDSFRITPKIESLVVFAIPDMPSKIQKDPSRTFWVILLTHRQTNKQTVWQKHYLLGGGKYKLQKYWAAIVQSHDAGASIPLRGKSRMLYEKILRWELNCGGFLHLTYWQSFVLHIIND